MQAAALRNLEFGTFRAKYARYTRRPDRTILIYMNPKELQLNFIVPTVTMDGANVFISVDGDVPRIDFFQARSEDDAHVHGDVVASIRFSNLEQLTSLQKTIAQTVKNHTEREK